jgi:hypothetical protein
MRPGVVFSFILGADVPCGAGGVDGATKWAGGDSEFGCSGLVTVELGWSDGVVDGVDESDWTDGVAVPDWTAGVVEGVAVPDRTAGVVDDVAVPDWTAGAVDGSAELDGTDVVVDDPAGLGTAGDAADPVALDRGVGEAVGACLGAVIGSFLGAETEISPVSTGIASCA